MADKKSWTNIVTPEARANYVNVFEPRESLNGDMRFSLTLMIPKDSKEIKALTEQMKLCAKDYFPKLPMNKLDFCLRDGDEKEQEAFHGHWILNPWSKYRPGLIDITGRPVISTDDFYSGCWCRASISFWGYDQKGKRGIGCSLNNIMKVRDDDALGGAIDPVAAFAGFLSDEGSNTTELISDEQHGAGSAAEDTDGLPF